MPAQANTQNAVTIPDVLYHDLFEAVPSRLLLSYLACEFENDVQALCLLERTLNHELCFLTRNMTCVDVKPVKMLFSTAFILEPTEAKTYEILIDGLSKKAVVDQRVLGLISTYLAITKLSDLEDRRMASIFRNYREEMNVKIEKAFRCLRVYTKDRATDKDKIQIRQLKKFLEDFKAYRHMPLTAEQQLIA